MKTILDLCRELPASEPELRERASEFNIALESALGNRNSHLSDYLGSIQAAKAATDAMIARGWQFDCGTVGYDADDWSAAFRRPQQGVDKPYKFDRECVTAQASTMEFAMSVAALLAAEVTTGPPVHPTAGQ